MTEAVRRLGKYEIIEEIGKGGFATVYCARDLDLGREVALKVLDPLLTRDPVWVARFRREARAAATLDHPRIVTVHEIGQAEGTLFIAMKLVEGGSLAQRLASGGSLPWDDAVQVVSQVAEALDYAHGQGVLHRDLKPANVLLDPRSGAVLTDFGFARLLADNSLSVSMSGGIVGTPATMAPEVWEGQAPTAQADVYALGCILYELVAGRPLFSGATPPAVMLAHFKPLLLPEAWPDGTPPGLGEVLQTALARDPAARYARAGDLAAAVAALSVDRLAEPYAALQAAVAGQQWQQALALAGEIKASQPDYRDVAALERQALAGIEQAARAQSAAQWRATAEEALAAGDLAAAQLALKQWQSVMPEDHALVSVQAQLQVQQEAAQVAEERARELKIAAQETTIEQPPVATQLPPPVVPPVSTAFAERPPSRGRSVWPLLAAVGALAVIVVLVLAVRGGDRPATGVTVIAPTLTSTAVVLPTRTSAAPVDAPVTATSGTIVADDIGITSSDWPTAGHDASRTGYNSAENRLAPPLKQLWMTRLDGYYADALAVSEGKVALAGDGGGSNQVYMLDATTGETLWDFKLTGGGSGAMGLTPTFGEGMVFFGGQGDGKLYAVDVVTGNMVWERSGLSGLYGSQLAAVGDRLYVPDETNAVIALRASTGESLWGEEGVGARGSPIAVRHDNVYGVQGSEERLLVALNAQSGESEWHFPDLVSGLFPLIIAGDERIYVNPSETEVVAANIRDGGIAWRTTLEMQDLMTGGGGPAALADNILYVSIRKDVEGNGGLAAIDAVTGRILWTFHTEGEGLTGVAVANNVVYAIGSEAFSEFEASTLYALDPKSGDVAWSSPLDGVGIASAVADGVLYVSAIKAVNGSPEGSIVYAFGSEASLSDMPVAEQATTGSQQIVTGAPQVGIVLPNKDEPRWLHDEARFNGLLTTAGVPVEILFSQGDTATEKANVESLLTKGVKVLILTPVDGAVAAAAAEAARQAGAKVISYDRMILGTDAVDYYVTFSGFDIGKAQAQYLVDKAEDSGNPLYLYAGAAYDDSAFDFFEGAWNVLQLKIADGTFVVKNSSEAVALRNTPRLSPDEMDRIFRQIATNWDPNTAKNLAESNLAVAPVVDKGNVFILGPNDGTARAIADAFATDKDVENYVITGQDAEKASIQYIIDGKQSMTVLKDIRTLAQDAVDAALAYLVGKTPPQTQTYGNDEIAVPSKPSDLIVVDKGNIKAVIIDSGYYPAGDFIGLK